MNAAQKKRNLNEDEEVKKQNEKPLIYSEFLRLRETKRIFTGFLRAEYANTGIEIFLSEKQMCFLNAPNSTKSPKHN